MVKKKKQPEVDRPLQVDRNKFEGIVRNLLNAPHTKREDVKLDKKRPKNLIPPQD